MQLSLSSPAGLTWPPRLDTPQLNRCITLAVLLHILVVLVFGNAPGGTARPGEGVWGSLNVSLIGPRTEPGAGPPPPVQNVDAGAVGSAATQRFGGVVRDENEAPRPNTPGAARQGNWNVEPGEKLIGEVAEPRASVVTPQPTPDAPKASEAAPPEAPVAEILPPVPTPEPAPPPPPAPVLRTLKQAPSAPQAQRPAGSARPAPEPRAVAPLLAESEPVKPLAPLVLPAPAPVLRSLKAAALPVPTAEPDRQPQLNRLTPEPSAAPLEPIRPMETVQPLPAARPAAEPSPTPAPAARSEAPATPTPAAAEPVRTVSPERLPSMAPERGTATQAPVSAVPSPSLAPLVGAPDAGASIGRDVATAPSTPASAPRPALNLALPRGGELSSQGTRGMLQLLPRPPDLKSKLSESIEKAAQADCRKAYNEMGLLAVVPLVRDAAKDKGCRW
nr:hypothetical protein [uncultured Roseateles sp.]